MYVSIFIDTATCVQCVHCSHTALYLHSANAASCNDQIHIITHRIHTRLLYLYTLHLVATSALLHADQRSHFRFRPHSLSWFGEWTMRYTITNWVLSNCQRITIIKMKQTLNSSGKIEPSEKPAAAFTVFIRTEASERGEIKVRKRKGYNSRRKKYYFSLYFVWIKKRWH